jgi:MFS family permease
MSDTIGGEVTAKAAPSAAFYLGFLLLLNVFNMTHRQMPISLGYQIEQGLGISHAQLGILIGFAFIVLYSIAGMFFGTVADRRHRPRLITFGLAVWTTATVLSGWAQSFGQILFLRVMVGVGAAVLTPTALGMLSDVFKPERRAFASGLYYAGVPLGAGASFITVALFEPVMGWRHCFHLVGVAGLIFVPLVLLLKDPPRTGVSAPAADTDPSDHPSTLSILGELFRTVRRSPALTASLVGSVIIVWPLSAAALSMTWLQVERGFSVTEAGLYSGLIFMIGGLIGNIGGGVVSDIFHRKWSGGRLWFLVTLQVVLGAPALAWYLLPPDSPLFYVAWFLTAVAGTSFFGAVFATVQDLVPAHLRSSMVGLLLLMMNPLAGGAAPWIAGMIGDASTLTRGLVICAVVGFLSIPVFIFAARRYATDIAKLES